jgi:glycosyltransferase involved in cell wall biosynthesis
MVSVALCTYNGEKHLALQLRSIVEQTIRPSEIVVCDDGSSDGTENIVMSFAKEFGEGLRFERNEKNLGPTKNFEKALTLCRGDIICLCDQDDVWRPNKIERIQEAFSASPEALYVFSDAEIVDENGTSVGRSLWDSVGMCAANERDSGQKQFEVMLMRNIMTGAGMALRSVLREAALPISSGWMHDHWLASFGVSIPEPLFQYRRHAGQVCGERKLTFLQTCQRSLSAGKDDALRKLQEFRELINRVRLSSMGGARVQGNLEVMKEKEAHMARRARIHGVSFLSRWWEVIKEASTGRYFRFSSSPVSSIVRDLL